MSKYLVTGCAGFIGYHLCRRLLSEGHEVVGADNLNDYYPVALKEYRLSKLECYALFRFNNCDITDAHNCSSLFFPSAKYDAIYHLAAMPGVRRSILDPNLYIKNNIQGSVNMLHLAGEYGIKKIVLASSSSVYGDGAVRRQSELFRQLHIHTEPFRSCSEDEHTDQPLSPYATSKRAMELSGYTYHKLYGYDVLIPRFFTVYGPAGRPDMAYFKFIQQMMAGDEITVYGNGKQERDFTYIDDIVEGLVSIIRLGGYEILNLGYGFPYPLHIMIKFIADRLGVEPKIKYEERQQGDAIATYSDSNRANAILNWTPEWSLEDGLHETIEWFRNEYRKTGLGRE